MPKLRAKTHKKSNRVAKKSRYTRKNPTRNFRVKKSRNQNGGSEEEEFGFGSENSNEPINYICEEFDKESECNDNKFCNWKKKNGNNNAFCDTSRCTIFGKDKNKCSEEPECEFDEEYQLCSKANINELYKITHKFNSNEIKKKCNEVNDILLCNLTNGNFCSWDVENKTCNPKAPRK